MMRAMRAESFACSCARATTPPAPSPARSAIGATPRSAQTGPDGEGARPSFLLRRPSSVSRTSQ